MQIDHFDSIFSQPVNAAREIHRFADDQRANTELPHQSAAIPARRQRGHHDLVTIGALPSRLAKCVGLAVYRRIVFLHSPVVPAPQQLAVMTEQCRANRNAALGESRPRLLDGNAQHLRTAVGSESDFGDSRHSMSSREYTFGVQLRGTIWFG